MWVFLRFDRYRPLLLLFLLASAGWAVVRSPVALAVNANRRWMANSKNVVYFVATDQKVLCLTFDDGPDPDSTPAILELLKKYGAKATFFVLGKQADKYPELIDKIIAEGHEIGNHSYSHRYLGRYKDDSALDEALRAEKAIVGQRQLKLTLFRFPGFSQDATDMAIIRQLGYTIIGASVDPKDASRPGVKTIVKRILTEIEPGDIVVLHDSGPFGGQTIAALNELLPRLTQDGYRLITVGELIKLKDQTPSGVDLGRQRTPAGSE